MGSAHALNKLLFDLRHDGTLRQLLIANPAELADRYHLDPDARKAVHLLSESHGVKDGSDLVRLLVTAGAHELQALMTLHLLNRA